MNFSIKSVGFLSRQLFNSHTFDLRNFGFQFNWSRICTIMPPKRAAAKNVADSTTKEETAVTTSEPKIKRPRKTTKNEKSSEETTTAIVESKKPTKQKKTTKNETDIEDEKIATLESLPKRSTRKTKIETDKTEESTTTSEPKPKRQRKATKIETIDDDEAITAVEPKPIRKKKETKAKKDEEQTTTEKQKPKRQTKKAIIENDDEEKEITPEKTKPKRQVKTTKTETKDEEIVPEEEFIAEPKPKGRKKATTTGKNKKEESNTNEPKSRGQKKTTKVEEDEEEQENTVKKTKTAANKTATDWKSIDYICSKKNSEDKPHNLIISSWNVGGIKSWITKGCLEYLKHETPDIFCMQETRCSQEKIPEELKNLQYYEQYWCASKKEGYAGVAIFTIKKPIQVTYGIGVPELDEDGRCITAEYNQFFLVCVYVPNSGRKLITLPKRLEWNKAFADYILSLEKTKPVIICGDMNVSHNEIDLARPASNKKNAGFTQEERDGMTDFLAKGFVDTFRELYPDKADAYTFWTYMANSRANNVGWRLDYFITSEKLMPKVCDNVIRSEILGSDHCPITLFINVNSEGPKTQS